MAAAATRWRPALGRRGTELLLFGLLELVYGWGIATDPRYGVVRGVGVLRSLAPMTWWGVLWMLCAAVALVLAIHPPKLRDSWGFAALYVPTAFWGAGNAVGWIDGDFPQAYTSAATWLTLTLILVLSERWPEPPPRIPGGERGRAQR